MAATALLLPPTTPPDYHRIVSHTLTIPTDPAISIPVGILACQRDPLLRDLDTYVVASIISQPPPGLIGKKVKKAVLAPSIPDAPIIEVILHDTVIFPEGGGQPTDTGVIKTFSDSTETVWEVIQAKRHGGHAVHYVKVPSGTGVDNALLAFSPRQKVRVALDQAGFDRRYDHMTMHTSQHLLSALMETRLNLPTLSWSLTAYPSPCYVEVPRGMTADEIMSIQNEANKLVFEGRKVYVEVEELDCEQNDVPIADSGRAVGKGLPQDYTGGVKRVVSIDGVDKNPCCGTHLPSIHNLQLFLLPHTEALSRARTTSARLYFLSGPRLISHISSSHNLLTDTASILSCGAPLVPERVSQVIADRKRAEKRADDVENELAGYIAKDLLREMQGQKEPVFLKHIHRTDDTGNALGFLNTISSVVSEASPASSYLIVLSSAPSAQTTTSATVLLVFGSDTKKVKEAGDKLKAKLGAKGGGQAKWSGKFTGVWLNNRESLVVDEVLNE